MSLERLKEGNARFVADKVDGKLQCSKRRSGLVSGQEPYAIVLGCADSRVVPELAFDVGLGEIFTMRVAGNVANVCTIASIEYAVAKLSVALLVVMGHENCGAVQAAMGGQDLGENLNHLAAMIQPAVAKGGTINEVVKCHARLTTEVLLEGSEILRQAVADGRLHIVPAFYELASGEVTFLD